MNTQTQLSKEVDEATLDDHHYQSCVEVINKMVSHQLGIVGVEVDTQQHQMFFDYDPNLISEPNVEQLAQSLTASVKKSLKRCAMCLESSGGHLCEAHAPKLEKRIRRIKGERKAAASYRGGVINIVYDNNLVSSTELIQRINQFGVSVASSEAELSEPAPQWLTTEKLEPICAVITLITMFIGAIIEHFTNSPTTSLIFYAIAYISGGVFGVKASLESLRHGIIDIDLLMVLVALGAAIVGSPFEGAMLLFLFSFSNVLQDFAMNRTTGRNWTRRRHRFGFAKRFAVADL